jgi:beta-galactosidase
MIVYLKYEIRSDLREVKSPFAPTEYNPVGSYIRTFTVPEPSLVIV